jgi:hypothetical protein
MCDVLGQLKFPQSDPCKNDATSSDTEPLFTLIGIELCALLLLHH